MTRDEVLKRLIYIPASTVLKPDKARNIRTRGENFVQIEQSAADVYDDFFEYEKELSEFVPARNTVSSHMDEIEGTIREVQPPKASFIVMEMLPAPVTFSEFEYSPNLENDSTNLSIQEDDSPKTFQFIQCEYFKSDGERCKKQAKKGQILCNKHRSVTTKDITND